MAGLIGASTSPVSGVGILAVVTAGLMLLAVVGGGAGADQTRAMIAYALFATAIVFRIATISNDNLQDLETGQLVRATPWRQPEWKSPPLDSRHLLMSDAVLC